MSACKQVLIVGYGDVGRRLAGQLHEDGCDILAWARQAREVSFGQIEAVDLDAEGDLPPVEASTCVYLVPPQRSGQADARLRRFLEQRGQSLKHMIYAGTSGVYGDCAGAWVDELAPLNPADGRARRRADAEQAVAEWAVASGGTAVLLRLAGIYGPGRLPRARIARGDPVVIAEQATWSNRVHVDDVVQAICAALEYRVVMSAGDSLPVNVADGRPSTMTDYLQACAQTLGLPPLPELPLDAVLAQASPALRGYLTQSRRLRIDRLRDVLHAPPVHTDFRKALANIVEL